MRYNTNDLAGILGVSTNTIRRFEAKGYLNAERNVQNGYRQFDHSDVEKIMYVEKYRKIGFSHEDVSQIFQADIGRTKSFFQDKMAELDRQIVRCMALRHMLKDDVDLIDKIEKYGGQTLEMDCCTMHYILYQEKGKICSGGYHRKALYRFMKQCPEFEYAYFFEKKDIEAGSSAYSEGILSNQIMTKKYEVCTDPPVQLYEAHYSVMKFLRLPLDFMDEKRISRKELQKLLFGDFLAYMEERGYILAGDVYGLKIGLSMEEGQEWQYVLMNFPVDRA